MSSYSSGHFAEVSRSSVKNMIPWSESPNNPHNWSTWKRVYHTAVPSMLSFEIAFLTSVTVPATALVAKEFSVSRTESLLTLTLYTIGVALGPFFIAPLSELFGRRKVYIVTTTFLVAFTGASGGAPNFGALLGFRFLAGTLGSAGIAMGAGTVADIWPPGPQGGLAGLFFILGPFLGPTFGPLAGAYILAQYNSNWRWTQWLSIMIAAPIWIGTLLMKETSRAQIGRHADKANSVAQRRKPKHFAQFFVPRLFRPIRMLFTEVTVFSLSLYTAYAYGMIFSYFASSSYVLALYYGFDSRQIGLSFLSVIIGYILAAIVFGVFDRTLFVKACRNAPNGIAAPEHRLYSGLVGSIFIPVGLFWYAWEAHMGGHWATLVASGIPFGFGALSLFLSTITYMVDIYQAQAAASALAANGLLRYTLGAVFPLFTLPMYQNLGVHYAGTVFACLSLLLLPIPWLLFHYGHRLRANDSQSQELKVDQPV